MRDPPAGNGSFISSVMHFPGDASSILLEVTASGTALPPGQTERIVKLTQKHTNGDGVCRYEHTEDGHLSSDAFIFKAPLPPEVVEKTGFEPQPGSENVVIWALKRAGLDVRNPCRLVL